MNTKERSLAEEITEGFEALKRIRQLEEEVAELKNARDYWCLQYKDVFSKLERIANERCGGKDEDSSRHRNKQ
jgi:hypothetical protein